MEDMIKRQEHAMLQCWRQLQLQKRRIHRRNMPKLTIQSEVMNPVSIEATTRAEIEALTSRSGFIRQQLAMKATTGLQRWSLQLQLIVTEDSKWTVMNQDDDMEAALQACETDLLRDLRCYDVVYRAGVRVSDICESLLDASVPMDVRELLVFSTRVDSFMCRITCLHNGKRVLFSSSEHIEHLQTSFERLLTEDTPVDVVISYIWKALKTQLPSVQ